jgi:hypothetical protein
MAPDVVLCLNLVQYLGRIKIRPFEVIQYLKNRIRVRNATLHARCSLTENPVVIIHQISSIDEPFDLGRAAF